MCPVNASVHVAVSGHVHLLEAAARAAAERRPRRPGRGRPGTKHGAGQTGVTGTASTTVPGGAVAPRTTPAPPASTSSAPRPGVGHHRRGHAFDNGHGDVIGPVPGARGWRGPPRARPRRGRPPDRGSHRRSGCPFQADGGDDGPTPVVDGSDHGHMGAPRGTASASNGPSLPDHLPPLRSVPRLQGHPATGGGNVARAPPPGAPGSRGSMATGAVGGRFIVQDLRHDPDPPHEDEGFPRSLFVRTPPGTPRAREIRSRCPEHHSPHVVDQEPDVVGRPAVVGLDEPLACFSDTRAVPRRKPFRPAPRRPASRPRPRQDW